MLGTPASCNTLVVNGSQTDNPSRARFLYGDNARGPEDIELKQFSMDSMKGTKHEKRSKVQHGEKELKALRDYSSSGLTLT